MLGVGRTWAQTPRKSRPSQRSETAQRGAWPKLPHKAEAFRGKFSRVRGGTSEVEEPVGSRTLTLPSQKKKLRFQEGRLRPQVWPRPRILLRLSHCEQGWGRLGHGHPDPGGLV